MKEFRQTNEIFSYISHNDENLPQLEESKTSCRVFLRRQLDIIIIKPNQTSVLSRLQTSASKDTGLPIVELLMKAQLHADTQSNSSAETSNMQEQGTIIYILFKL
jgi:hypothetical protein